MSRPSQLRFRVTTSSACGSGTDETLTSSCWWNMAMFNAYNFRHIDLEGFRM